MVDKAKYLSIIIDNQLNFGKHMKNIENKVDRAVGILSKLNYFLPDSAMLQLHYSLVHPHILYDVAIWGNTFPTYLAKLSRLQNKPIRLVTASDWKASAYPLYHATNVLPLSDMIKYEIAKIVYCHNQKCLPSSFDHYFTFAKNYYSRLPRFSLQDHLIIPLFKANVLSNLLALKFGILFLLIYVNTLLLNSKNIVKVC